jgi:hypothetical protein
LSSSTDQRHQKPHLQLDENDTFSGPAQVVATDRATNDGAAIFTVTRDAADPTLSLSAVSEDTNIALDWSASDPGSGLATCALEVREDEGAWQPYAQSCAGTDTYAAQFGHAYTSLGDAARTLGAM